MLHNDPVLWAEYDKLARQAEEMRLHAATLPQRAGFPQELVARAGMLAYHLRAAHNEAKALAGDPPEEAAAGGKP
jgi:hypothetical protein